MYESSADDEPLSTVAGVAGQDMSLDQSEIFLDEDSFVLEKILSGVEDMGRLAVVHRRPGSAAENPGRQLVLKNFQDTDLRDGERGEATELINGLIRGINLSKRIIAPQILRLNHAFFDQMLGSRCLVFDSFVGDLGTYTDQRFVKELSTLNALNLSVALGEIGTGLAFMHERGIVHGNICPQTFSLDQMDM